MKQTALPECLRSVPVEVLEVFVQASMISESRLRHTVLHSCLPCITAAVLRADRAMQNYVGSQIAMFANGLAHRLGQHGYHIPTEIYKESAREVFQLLISEPSPRRTAARPQDLQLVFRHDCLCVSTSNT